MAFPIPTELVDAARNGCPLDIERFLEAVWPDAYRLARAVLGEDQRAQDAAQEACIIMYRSIASLRSTEAFRVWFYRIVVREANEIKRRHARTETPPRQHVQEEADSAAALDLWRALSSLPGRLRDVVVLRYFEDLSSREIADVLGIPAGTVRFRLMIAMQRLKPLLDDDTAHLPRASEERINAI